MNPLPRHRDERGVEIEIWLDVIVKTCSGFTDTRREMVVVEIQEVTRRLAQNISTLGQCRILLPGRTDLSLKGMPGDRLIPAS